MHYLTRVAVILGMASPFSSAPATVMLFSTETKFLQAVEVLNTEGFEGLPAQCRGSAALCGITTTELSTPLLDVTTDNRSSFGMPFIYVGDDALSILPVEGVNTLVAGAYGGSAFKLSFSLHTEVQGLGLYITDFGEAQTGSLVFGISAEAPVTIASVPPLRTSSNVIFFGYLNTDVPFDSFYLDKTTIGDGIGVDKILLGQQRFPGLVPLPAAIWLLGAGFLGYLGLGRRGRADTAA